MNNKASFIYKNHIYSSVLFLFLSISSGFSQEYSWFYLRAKDTVFQPVFKKVDNLLVYKGEDEVLKSVLNSYSIFEFKKTFRKASKKNLKKTFFVISDSNKLLKELLSKTSHLFEFGELIQEEDKKIFEPNDYGLTSTIGYNLGLPANLDYLDYLGLPEAWFYTTGSKDIIIGISDAAVDKTNLDFIEKTKTIRKSSYSKGHGSGVASIAAGQGDNEYGVPGICYDCTINTTTYGDFKNLDQLLELSRAGVKVINCSWVGSKFYQTAQDAIDEMFNNGTIIVAAAGNTDWSKTKGKRLTYPASYNHVISISSVMHRYESVYDNILISDKGNPYGDNIKGFVGRTVGFKDHDTTKTYKIYQQSVRNLNSEIDLLGPSVGLMRYSKFISDSIIEYTEMSPTSPVAPLITGSIGLMLSLYPCLSVDEVESILKFTSINIDHIEVNKPYFGNYGAGVLQTGKAVKMVYDMFSENETTIIENQNFSRWDFKLTAFSKEVLIQNQKFTSESTLNLTAKNRIVIGENTVLRPNAKGKIILKIDPALEKQCELQLREGFPNNKYYYPKE